MEITVNSHEVKDCKVCKKGAVLPVVFSGGDRVFVCEECDSLWRREGLEDEPSDIKTYLKSKKSID